MKIIPYLLTLLVIGAMATAIQAGDAMKYTKLSDVPAAKWQALAQKEIYFGHQSVGYNIIDGIKARMKGYPQIQLNIVESRKMAATDGAFVHSRVGENTKPDSKIKDFVKVIDQELGRTPDMAALKFCFGDFYDKIDQKQIFTEYKKAMAQLEKEHPGLTIIHFTIPLRTQAVSWKTKVKLLLGKEPWEFADNIKRNQFNQLLLNAYQGKEPVFDIAGYEAAMPGNKQETFEYKGRKYLAMWPGYSSDGGHLNSQGARWIAEHFLLFLVNNI